MNISKLATLCHQNQDYDFKHKTNFHMQNANKLFLLFDTFGNTKTSIYIQMHWIYDEKLNALNANINCESVKSVEKISKQIFFCMHFFWFGYSKSRVKTFYSILKCENLINSFQSRLRLHFQIECQKNRIHMQSKVSRIAEPQKRATGT